MVMTEIYDNLTRETLSAIELNKGTKNLSLRAIARKAGCSHANVYHYTNGLDGLLWAAYQSALKDFADCCRKGLDPAGDGFNAGSGLARAVCGFALDHEGLYRLLWLDSLPQPVPDPVMEMVKYQSREYVRWITGLLHKNGYEAERDAGFLFSFLQGEISSLLAGRLLESPEMAVEHIETSAGELWNILSKRN
jgi:AcrR family transcriptional regulator